MHDPAVMWHDGATIGKGRAEAPNVVIIGITGEQHTLLLRMRAMRGRENQTRSVLTCGRAYTLLDSKVAKRDSMTHGPKTRGQYKDRSPNCGNQGSCRRSDELVRHDPKQNQRKQKTERARR